MCPEEVVKYPNLSAETFNTTHEGSRDSLLAKPERSGSSLALLASEKLTGLVQMENRNWLCRAVRV